MKVSDPIANLLTSLSNASRVGRFEVFVPASNHKERILTALQKEGVVRSFARETAVDGDKIKINLSEGFTHFKRLSKPGCRLYVGRSKLPRYTREIVLISTPQGIMTAKQALKNNLGGELLMEVS